MKIEFHRHNLGSDEMKSLNSVLESVFLTTGPATERFEKEFGRYFNSDDPPEVIAVSSCTMALYLTLKSLGINRGEIITTPLSFMATSNAILYTGAEPVFVDVEKETGNINAELIESKISEKTAGILPVHLYGQMANMVKISGIAKRYNLLSVEDSAHCIEGSRQEIKPGQLSGAACLSFHALKTLTCGEGGAILTYDQELAKKLRIMRAHGITRSVSERNLAFSHQDIEELGLKCNMPDTLSALLLPQIPKLNENRQRREEIAKKYYNGLSGYVDFPKIKPDAVSARNIFSIWVDASKRDLIVQGLRDNGVGCTVQYYPIIPLLSYYQRRFIFELGQFPNAERISSQTIALPFYPTLRDEEVKYVIDKVITEISKY